MCDIYRFPEEKIACEYLAYLNQKKYPISQPPTVDILEGFENESLKSLAAKRHEKSAGPVIYNSMTIHQAEDDDDGGLSSYYGDSNKTPVRSKQVKRQVSPDDDTITNKKRIGGQDIDSPLPFSPSLSAGKGR